MEIQRSFRSKVGTGKLYVVATPIGNMDDITLRAIKILSDVSLIITEDTRTTGFLLRNFDISKKRISFHEYNEKKRIPKILSLLLSGHDVAQVSDAGLPGISDPGHDLVRAAISKKIDVVPIPGSSAGITALVASGLIPQPHIFYGFLPRKSGRQLLFFESKKTYTETQIFYESPHRILKTCRNMLKVYGDREMVLVRELTKRYEEFQRGRISELITYWQENPVKGECLFIVEGHRLEKKSGQCDDALIEEINVCIGNGKTKTQAIREVAQKNHVNRRKLYAWYHNNNC